MKAMDRAKQREIFERNLCNEGLIVQHDPASKDGYTRNHFVKLFATNEVLERYADILNLRFPLKKLIPKEEQKIERQGLSIVAQVARMKTWLKLRSTKLQAMFMWNTSNLPEEEPQLTAEFSRNKTYLFDTKAENFFSKSVRSRIVEFILKRKSFSGNVS